MIIYNCNNAYHQFEGGGILSDYLHEFSNNSEKEGEAKFLATIILFNRNEMFLRIASIRLSSNVQIDTNSQKSDINFLGLNTIYILQ